MMLSNPKKIPLWHLMTNNIRLRWEQKKYFESAKQGCIPITDIRNHDLYKGGKKIGENIFICSKTQGGEKFYLGYRPINTQLLDTIGKNLEHCLELETTGTILTLQKGYHLEYFAKI